MNRFELNSHKDKNLLLYPSLHGNKHWLSQKKKKFLMVLLLYIMKKQSFLYFVFILYVVPVFNRYFLSQKDIISLLL